MNLRESSLSIIWGDQFVVCHTKFRMHVQLHVCCVGNVLSKVHIIYLYLVCGIRQVNVNQLGYCHLNIKIQLTIFGGRIVRWFSSPLYSDRKSVVNTCLYFCHNSFSRNVCHSDRPCRQSVPPCWWSHDMDL